MIDQIGIAVFGVAAVWFVNHPNDNAARWGCIFGFLAEPFWLYTGLANQQWGIVLLTFVYGWGWGRGVWHKWIKPKLRCANPL